MVGSILRPGRNFGVAIELDNAALLVDANDYYRAFFRAASQAKRFILIAGWQFDSRVPLVRGPEAPRESDAGFLPFLNELCVRNPDLHVYILAWDYALLYAREREFAQGLVFEWHAHERVRFCFDDHHPVGASLHQKFVVLDDQLGFIGGEDICENRWDDRFHRAQNPLRATSDGEAYGPYHELQMAIAGAGVRALSTLFEERWHISTGERLKLAKAPASQALSITFEGALPLCAKHAALSQTRGRLLDPPLEPLDEIRVLYKDAIARAEELIYLENQYLTSSDIVSALVDRMRDATRPALEIVLVLPMRAEAFKEELALGLRQAEAIRELRRVARETGHALGVYATGPSLEEQTYIHSKLFLVDDAFLTVGSANTTNRSLGVDTELNISFEGVELRRDLRHMRASLLAEHSGVYDEAAARDLEAVRGLVERLDALAASARHRLYTHPNETFVDRSPWLRDLGVRSLAYDPKNPVIEDSLHFAFSPDAERARKSGLSEWWRRLVVSPGDG